MNENGSGGLTIASRGINTVDIGIGQDLTYSTKAGSGFTLRTDKNPNTVRAGLTGEYQTAKGVIIRAGVSNNLRKGKNDLQGTSASG